MSSRSSRANFAAHGSGLPPLHDSPATQLAASDLFGQVRAALPLSSSSATCACSPALLLSFRVIGNHGSADKLVSYLWISVCACNRYSVKPCHLHLRLGIHRVWAVPTDSIPMCHPLGCALPTVPCSCSSLQHAACEGLRSH